MALHAILTAGGRLPRALQSLVAAPVKALLPVGGRSLLETAVSAARGCGLIERVVAVGGPEVQAAAADLPGCEYAPLGAGVMDNIYNGFVHCGGEAHDYLVLSPDLPFASGPAVREFLTAARAAAEFSAPLVSAADFLKRFPGAPNHFERLGGARLTMGSALYFSGRALKTNIPLGRDFYRCRKYPHRLAVLLGWPVLWGYLTGTLRIETLERRGEQLMGVTVRAVWVRDASLAYDVDNRINYDYAERLLAQSASGG